MAHIDVRGPWPVYIKGMIAIELTGWPRFVSVEVAEVVIKHI